MSQPQLPLHKPRLQIITQEGVKLAACARIIDSWGKLDDFVDFPRECKNIRIDYSFRLP